MSEFIMKASTDEQAEFCRRYSNMQELIRCKDCKHYCKDDMSLPFCNIHESLWLDDDWFCADGEKKVNE